VVGLRYGSGWLVRKTREPQQVYWKGPSVGSISAATLRNASPWFTTCARIGGCSSAFPAWKAASMSWRAWGSLLRSGGVTLAPMRTGVGLRAGVNAHYQVYSDKRDWFPL